jgi:hypothetical protein
MAINAATVASLASSDLAKKILEPLAAKIGLELLGIAKDKWRKYTHSFDRYLGEVENKHKYFSSQIFSNEGQLLENYYIPLTLQKAGSTSLKAKIVVSDYPADLIAAYKDALIVDTAGMGKSTLLKFIFLRSLKVADAIPVFIELRKLSKERTIWAFILEELRLPLDENNNRMLTECLREGVFTFFLDGFDEISDDDKKAVSSQIIELKAKAGSSRFILSSREEQSLAYLAEFHRFNIKPLSKQEAYSLIRKIAPDPKIAASLIEKVKDQPHESLDEFLTNPLLVSLLVKSFLHSPILPVRLSEFYRQVFDALFQNHDARKELGGFARRKRSGLDLDRFHKAMRGLGVLSYQSNKLEFSTDELVAQIERVKILTSEIDYSASNFRHDLLHAVPLFAEEGASSRWAHKSLQEYFAAAYICVDAKEDQTVLLNQLYDAGVGKNANLLRLCADIDGKTFKHVLVKRYLSERLMSADEVFSPDEFPEVDQQLLKARRSVICESSPMLMVLPRAVPVEKARDRIRRTLPELAFDGHFAPFDSNGLLVQPERKVKYFVSLVGNRFSTMDSIIGTYFHERILLMEPRVPIKRLPRNLPFYELLPFDCNPDNPLNSPENFASSLQVLKNIMSYFNSIYDIDKMRSLYQNVLQHEQGSTSLTIRFG